MTPDNPAIPVLLIHLTNGSAPIFQPTLALAAVPAAPNPLVIKIVGTTTEDISLID